MPNIFFTEENLVFSLPLITLTMTYAFFKYIPLMFGIPLLAVAAVAGRSYLSYRTTNQINIVGSMEENAAKASASAMASLLAGEDATDAVEKKKARRKDAKKKGKGKDAAAAAEPVKETAAESDDNDDDDYDFESISQNKRKN